MFISWGCLIPILLLKLLLYLLNMSSSYMATSIVSDRDPVLFLSFELSYSNSKVFSLLCPLPITPQSDGQTEAVNKSLEHYLRSFSSDRPTE